MCRHCCPHHSNCTGLHWLPVFLSMWSKTRVYRAGRLRGRERWRASNKQSRICPRCSWWQPAGRKCRKWISFKLFIWHARREQNLTCRLFSGSMRWTWPVVPNTRDDSIVCDGCTVPTWSGALGTSPKLFLFNWIAKPDMACIALLVKVMSMHTWPLRRENVPWISKPLPFSAGNQTTFGIVTVVVGALLRPKISPSSPEPVAVISAAGAALPTPN